MDDEVADMLGVDDDAAADPIGVDVVGPLLGQQHLGARVGNEGGGGGGGNDLEQGLLGGEPAAPRGRVGGLPQSGAGWVVMVGGPHPIAQLERVKWLGLQLQGYGFSRADARHSWLKGRCSCLVRENPRAGGGDGRRDECGCGRLLRWVLGLSWWSLFLLVGHLTYAIAEPVTMLFSQDNPFSTSMLVSPGDLEHLSCPQDFVEPTAGAHLHPEDTQWSDDVQRCCVAECTLGVECSVERNARASTCNNTTGMHWKSFPTDPDWNSSHPWACCPDDPSHAEVHTILDDILLCGLLCLLLVSRIMVLKIATPGGGGARAHPLSDAIDPFTLLAVSLEMAGQVTDGTPDDVLRRSRQRASAELQPGNFPVPVLVHTELPRERWFCCWYKPAHQEAPRERRCCCSSVCGSAALLRQTLRLSLQNSIAQVKPLDESANAAISNACRAVFIQAWLPIIGLGLWWCFCPLAELRTDTQQNMTGMQFMLTDAEAGLKWQVLRPVLFVLLCYPGLVTTALLLRAVCTIHRQHADAIVDGIGQTFCTTDEVHRQFIILHNGLQVTGQRWEGILFMQFLIFLALVAISFVELLVSRNTLLMEVAIPPLAQMWPLVLCIRSIMKLNSSVTKIPARIARRNDLFPKMTLEQRHIICAQFERLTLGFRVFGAKLTTERLRNGLLLVSATLAFSWCKGHTDYLA
jgi:hypothetical protein